MISPLRFGNIHVLDPLVYQRFKDLLEQSPGKSRYASPFTEANHPAFNFLADVTREEDVRDGYNDVLWRCYDLPEGKAMLLSNINGRHDQSYRKFRDELRVQSPEMKWPQIAQAFLDMLAGTEKINRVLDSNTPGLTETGVPGRILLAPVFRHSLRRFTRLGFPPNVAEGWATEAFNRSEALGRYMPRLSRVFGFPQDSGQQDDFVRELFVAIRRVFDGKLPLQELEGKALVAHRGEVLGSLQQGGFRVRDLSPYDQNVGAETSEESRLCLMAQDLGGFSRQMAEAEGLYRS